MEESLYHIVSTLSAEGRGCGENLGYAFTSGKELVEHFEKE